MTIGYVNADSKDEYVQIENLSDESVDLSGWTIESEPDQIYRFQKTVLGPGCGLRVHSGPGAAGEFV